MSGVTLPIAFTALGNPTIATPLVPVQRNISSLQADELLVRVTYSSINGVDGKLQQSNKFQMPLPLVLGFDFSGSVVAAGGAAEQGQETAHEQDQHHHQQLFVVGDEVMGCAMAGGSFAEYVVVKRKDVALRGAIPPADASTYGVAYSAAYESLMITDDLAHRRGQTIYIAGAAGGVGHFAVQLAKLHGLRVIGSAGQPESLDLLKTLPVDHIINYRAQDVVQEVLALTDGQGADLVYDPTYMPVSLAQSAACVRSGGRWLKLGQLVGEDVEAVKIAEQRGAEAIIGDVGRYFRDPVYVAQRHKVVQGLHAARDWYKEGKVRPHITAIIPFEAKALQKALDEMVKEKKGLVGKVVVKVGA